MKKLIIFTAFVAVVTLAAFFGTRHLCLSCSLSGHGRPLSYTNLELDREKEKTLRQLELDFQKKADTLCMKICDFRFQTIKLLEGEGSSLEVINKKIEEVGQLQIALEKETAMHMLEVKRYLTPVQAGKYFSGVEQTIHQSMNQMSQPKD